MPEAARDIYRRYQNGRISRARAKDLLGDDWDEVAQIMSIQRARKGNERYGYSAEELTEFFG